MLRLAIFLVPILIGFLAGGYVSRALPEPTTAYEVVFWWTAIIAVATVTSTAVDRGARRLLPLTVLLKMTMLFPDAAPSRLKMARKAGNVSELRRRILEAESGEGDVDLAEMAELVLSLSAALSNHDRKTRGHSERTRAYTDMIAEEMGIPEEDRDRLRWAALLHDVGKLEVPAEILNKSSKLSDEEWKLVQQHPINGMRLVGPLIPWLGEWAKTIEHHHERYDGTGYPHGLAGHDITLGARIVTVADAYDVMTSGRSYQRAKSPSEARREIASMAGEQFDPVVARALMNVSLGKLRWSTGPLAVLAEIPFLRGLPEVGRDVAMVMTTSAVMTTGFVAGVVPTPQGVPVSPSEIVQVVIAGADLRQDPAIVGSVAGSAIAGGAGTAGDSVVAADPPAGDTTTTTVTIQPTTTTATGTPTGSPTTTLPTTAAPAASPPVATNDSAVIPEDTSVALAVLANDSDPDGDLDPSTLAVAANGSLGTATASGGSITYQPAPNATGSDSFVYRVCDAGGLCDTASVSITIAPSNDPPVAPPTYATTDAGVYVTVPLSYSDPDGDPLTCVMVAPPSTGAATVPANCSSLGYSPPLGASGDVTIGLTVSDGTVTVTTTVTVTVVPVNSPPVAVDDTATSTGAAVSIPVLANDSDPDGDPLTLASVSGVSSGSVTVSGNSAVYTPPSGWSGTATFSYQVCDDSAACDTGTVTVSVSAAGVVIANDDTATIGRNGRINITVLANDSGPYDPATLSVGAATGGTVSVLGGSGRAKFIADPGFTGIARFTYTVCSAAGDCDSATVRVTVG